MKTSRQRRARLWVEELESRTVLTSLAGTSLLEAMHSASATSSNWSGYAAETNLNSPASDAVSAVSGSWVVPKVTGTSTAYSSVWVGIDGYSSSTVEQIGTDSDIVNGKATYYAWYEMYPNASINIVSLTVSPGDTISASVDYVAATNKYVLSITDETTGKSYSPAAQTVSGAQRSSAEWIVEAPSSNSGILPLADFGTVKFLSASATIEGVTGPVDDFANAAINMVSSYTEDTTSALTDTTTAPITSSFTVSYDAPPSETGGPGPHGRGGFGFGWWFEPNLATSQEAAGTSSATVNVPTLASGLDTLGATFQTQTYVTSTPPVAAATAQPTFAISLNSAVPASGDRAFLFANQAESIETAVSLDPFALSPAHPDAASIPVNRDLFDFPDLDGSVLPDAYLGDSQDAAVPESLIDNAAAGFNLFSSVGAGLVAVFMTAYWSNPGEDLRRRQEASLLFPVLPSR